MSIILKQGWRYLFTIAKQQYYEEIGPDNNKLTLEAKTVLKWFAVQSPVGFTLDVSTVPGLKDIAEGIEVQANLPVVQEIGYLAENQTDIYFDNLPAAAKVYCYRF